MLEVRGLKKQFGDFAAVQGVSFGVSRGQCVGLLGPNGAGKTTTVSMIAGLLRPDSGGIWIDGAPLSGDADPWKRKLGLVPQEVALYEEFSARENLATFGALYSLTGAALQRAIDRVLDIVALRDWGKHRVSTFSGGMKRRLNLAAALMHAPELVILDEPTVGVDPQSRNAIFENLERLQAEGVTLLYTTHNMEEAERLCDWIVIMDRGQVIADDTLRGLYRTLPPANRLMVDLDSPPPAELPLTLQAVPGIGSVTVDEERLTIAVQDLSVAPRALSVLVDHDLKLLHVETDRPNLEAVFLNMTGRKLRDA